MKLRSRGGFGRCRRALLVLVATLGPAGAAPAQCEPGWRYGPDQALRGADGNIAALTRWDPDGPGPQPELLVIGGGFGVAGQVVSTCIAAWDGVGWRSFGDGLGATYPFWVGALAVYNGELIAGGRFITPSGATNIARWDGASWQPLGGGINSRVDRLLVHGGELIAGGLFEAAGGQPASAIAAWNGSSWRALGAGLGGASPAVLELITYRGDLIAAGTFTSAGPAPAANIARWDGSAWYPLGTGTDRSVSALAVYDDRLIVGGDFFSAGGAPAVYVAAWDGSAWSSIGVGVGELGGVRALVAGRELWAGGRSPGGLVPGGVRRWDGASWRPVGDGFVVDAESRAVVDGLLEYQGGMIACGWFTACDGESAMSLAKWDGARWRPAEAGFNCDILALWADGEQLIAGGGFTAAGAARASRVARWDGLAWTPLGAGITQGVFDWPPTVSAVAVFNGDVVAGGLFAIPDDEPSYCIARWDGKTWSRMGAGMDNAVFALAVFNNELIAAGWFYTAGGVPANRIARWDGAAWHPLGAGLEGHSYDTIVYALTVFNNELIAGGYFTTAGGVSASNIARWDGQAWRPLGSGVTHPSYGIVRALSVHQGQLAVGGQFSQAGGEPVRNLALWDGVTWHQPGTSFNNTVDCLASYRGQLVAGGSFASITEGPAMGVARRDSTGWHAMGAGFDVGPAIGSPSAAAVFRDQVVFGGDFLSVDGRASAYWAPWACACAADLNGDGQVDFSDYLDFLNLYELEDPRVDLNQDGLVDFSDYLEFLNLYESGC